MRDFIGVSVLVGCLVLSTACRQQPSASQTPAGATTNPQPSATRSTAIKAAPPPVDDAATRLPDGFRSDDIEPVIRALAASGKSEFETTDAYRKRLATEAQTTFYNFLVDPLDTIYDADRQQMNVRLWIKVDPSTTDIEEDSMTIPVQNKVDRGSFSAANAFGATVQVQRTTEAAHAVAAVPIPAEMIGKRVAGAMYQTPDGQHYQRFLEVRLRLSPDDARARKPSLRFLLRARPSTRTKRRTYDGDYEWKATITSPTSRVTQTHAAYVDLAGVALWVVDVARGDILAKTSLAELLKLRRTS